MKDLRTHLALLEEHFPGEICTVEKGPLSPAAGDTCALLYYLEQQNKWPCVRFKHVTDLSGARWPGEVATRVDASTEQLQIFRDLLANRQDESKARPLQVGGLFIDSTKPVARGYPEMGRPIKAALERLELNKYLTADTVERLKRDL